MDALSSLSLNVMTIVTQRELEQEVMHAQTLLLWLDRAAGIFGMHKKVVKW